MKRNSFKVILLLICFTVHYKLVAKAVHIANIKSSIIMDGLTVNIRDFGAKGDGHTDDSDAINKAINKVFISGGGTVIIPSSNKSYLFRQINLKTNVILKGTGGTLKFIDNIATNKNTSYYPINNLGSYNVRYENLIIYGNGKNNANFKVCDVITCVGENSQVINCKIYDAPDSGIMFSSTKNGLCDNNEIIGGRDCGIYINASKENPNFGAVISNNKINDYIITGIGIKRMSSNIVVNNNQIINCGNGITLEDFTNDKMGYPTYITLKDNLIKHTGYYDDARLARRGISISRGDNITVENNAIEDTKGVALVCNNAINTIVRNNTLVSVEGNAVDLMNGKNNVLMDNIIKGKINARNNSGFKIKRNK